MINVCRLYSGNTINHASPSYLHHLNPISKPTVAKLNRATCGDLEGPAGSGASRSVAAVWAISHDGSIYAIYGNIDHQQC